MNKLPDSELERILSLAGKATRGPWEVKGEDRHWKENTAYIKVRGTSPGHRWPIADCRFIDGDGFNERKEALAIAEYIAAANPESIKSILQELLEYRKNEKA